MQEALCTPPASPLHGVSFTLQSEDVLRAKKHCARATRRGHVTQIVDSRVIAIYDRSFYRSYLDAYKLILLMYIMFNGSFVTRLTCVSSVTRLPMSSLQVLPNVQFSRISARIKHRLVSGCACRASSAADPCIRVTYKQN